MRLTPECQTAGAATFVASLVGWYVMLTNLFAAVDFPIQLPIGDLSTVIKGSKERARAKREMQNGTSLA